MDSVARIGPVADVGLPSGTVTFLFTDIEGSTVRWDRDPAAMELAVRAHDELVRRAIVAHRGYVFKTIGDAFCAAFWRPDEALAAAIAAQTALAAADFRAVGGLRVRMAIHSGSTDERDGDYFGAPVNRVARLLSIGHGGQVLVSEIAANVARADAAVELRDLGLHALKDLSKPEHVFELAAASLAGPFPPLRSLGIARHNLPLQLTDFIGRGELVGQIGAAVSASRLVTLLGAGGVGKTRTAVQAAAELLDGSGDGVWFVDLAPLSSAAYVIPELAAVLGVREDLGRPLIDTVLAEIKSKELLLIVDNCEHVIDEVRGVVRKIVGVCPRVRVLATSREALGIAGEAVVRMPSLTVPPADAPLSAAEALRFEAVALFVTRAEAADKRFVLTDANASIVADICRRLDGIALAIELAAPRIKVLNLSQISTKLGERFRLLTGGSRSALPRQQTMRALIDWSYDLLEPAEQRIFRRLSIFAGGWTLEAAAAVCAADGADEYDVLDSLTSLADKSLVVVDFLADGSRFRLLESMREYALARANADPESADLGARRAAYFTTFIDAGVPFDPLADRGRLAAVEAELDNLRELLSWAIQAGHDVELGGRVAVTLSRFWSMRYPREGQRWLDLAQAALAGSSDVGLAARIALAIAAMLPHGTFERMAATEAALRTCRTAADPLLLTRALSAYGEQLSPAGRLDEARAAFDEALACARSKASDWDTARALAGLGELAIEIDDVATARDVCGQAIAIFERIHSIDGVAYVSISFAQTEFKAGNWPAAQALVARAREAYGVVQNYRSSSCAANYLAAFALLDEKVADARAHACDALEILNGDRHPLFVTNAIESLAYVATLSGDVERGAVLMGFVDAAFATFAHPRDMVALVCHQRHRALLSQTLGTAELATRLEAGARIDLETAIGVALAVPLRIERAGRHDAEHQTRIVSASINAE